MIAVKEARYYILNMKTRMPFQYGIATLHALPHVFLVLTVQVDGKTVCGVSAEGLPPKWFRKDPAQRFEDELDEMIAVLKLAADHTLGLKARPTVFQYWRDLYDQMSRHYNRTGLPALLWGLGVSMVERALMDAFCKAVEAPLHEVVRSNRLGLALDWFHPELAGTVPATWLPRKPLDTISVRHTIGMSDPLRVEDVDDVMQPNDGLPRAFEEVIEHYKSGYFKFKLTGQLAHDAKRLGHVLNIMSQANGTDFKFTLDGNEYFHVMKDFLSYWEALKASPILERYLSCLLFLEQPFHRSIALDVDLNPLKEHDIPIIIDESDDTPTAIRMALKCGYAGTSHKNCKGVFKSIATACYLKWLEGQGGTNPYLLSAEDLATVGPVALLQDLAVAALLGITHIERNGHHYFKGLTMYPLEIQQQICRTHSDVYTTDSQVGVTLRVEEGQLNIGSVNESPFGYGFDFEPAIFGQLDAWSSASLDSL